MWLQVHQEALQKIVICGEGLIEIPRMSEMDLKNDCQLLDNLEHVQNMCVRLQGIWEHLSQASVVLSG